jgi:hypothetical protein
MSYEISLFKCITSQPWLPHYILFSLNRNPKEALVLCNVLYPSERNNVHDTAALTKGTVARRVGNYIFLFLTFSTGLVILSSRHLPSRASFLWKCGSQQMCVAYSLGRTSQSRRQGFWKQLSTLTSSTFWGETTCSPVKDNQYFGGTCRLHLQG